MGDHVAIPLEATNGPVSGEAAKKKREPEMEAKLSKNPSLRLAEEKADLTDEEIELYDRIQDGDTQGAIDILKTVCL